MTWFDNYSTNNNNFQVVQIFILRLMNFDLTFVIFSILKKIKLNGK